jgi:hypothetical protein
MALTCTVLLASQITKKSATASGTLRKSSDKIFSPFFSCIAWMTALKSLEFLFNRVTLLRLRLFANLESCSNNQFVLMNNFMLMV